MFLPGESQGRGSLVGCRLWGRTESDMTERMGVSTAHTHTHTFPTQGLNPGLSSSVVSDSLQPHESQHARPPCPSPTPGLHSDSRPSVGEFPRETGLILRCAGKAGNPFQMSLSEVQELVMEREAWRAAIHGVTKSRTRLSDFTFTFLSHALEKEMATHSSVLDWRIPASR